MTPQDGPADRRRIREDRIGTGDVRSETTRAPSVDLAISIMDAFADRTGISSARAPVRYLWTDAFAVCNYLGLYAATGENRLLGLARAIVDQVHHVLGRHRPDDARRGWISGLPEREGEDHPTAGGLRIGKPHAERSGSEPYRPGEEWDRDGQYYHYLTKWMFALGRMARVTGDVTYRRWAVELARAAHAGFVTRGPGGPRLYWKMSIDLSRPLVPSSGHHDPLDGLMATSGLAVADAEGAGRSVLRTEIEELASMCEGRDWLTTDALGVGGLLVDTLRCARLAVLEDPVGRSFLAPVLRDAVASMHALGDFPFLRLPAEHRLAFRELGLALGLASTDRLRTLARELGSGSSPPASTLDLEALAPYAPVGAALVDFWSRDESRLVPSWTDHRDISDVMWATCLAPAGFLDSA